MVTISPMPRRRWRRTWSTISNGLGGSGCRSQDLRWAGPQELAGRNMDYALSFLGFGPAPAYVSRDATQNRISYLYQRHVAPVSRPSTASQKADIDRQVRSEVLTGIQNGDRDAVMDAISKGASAGISLAQFKRMMVPGDIIMFRSFQTGRIWGFWGSPAQTSSSVICRTRARQRERIGRGRSCNDLRSCGAHPGANPR